VDRLDDLRRPGGPPVVVGFGVSSAEQVRSLGAHADGVVVGSAIVSRVAEPGTTLERAARVEAFVRSLHSTSDPR
jgi:tryptophan synthase alpha chain